MKCVFMRPADPAALRVLILKAERLYADFLRQVTVAEFPDAVCTLATSVAEAEAALEIGSFDLMLAGMTLQDGDILQLLSSSGYVPRPIRHILVVTSNLEPRLIATLRSLAVNGVFDSASDDLQHFAIAIRRVCEGQSYWSPGIMDTAQRASLGPSTIWRLLTAAEQRALAVFGDGCDDKAASDSLGIKQSTARSLRRELHRKLGVQHRGELMRLAVVAGYVRFTPTGVMRIGFSLLSAACGRRTDAIEFTAPAAGANETRRD